MDFATPSSRFKRDAIQQPAPMNFYTPPKNPSYSNSGVNNVGADPSTGVIPADTTPKYVAPAPAATRPGSTPPPGMESYAMPVLNGLQNSSTPATTDTTSNIVSVAGNTLAGAATGALTGAAIGAAGGPIGAAGGAIIGGGVALITSGLNAWLGNRQAKAEQDKAAALNAEALRLKQQEIARDEKWRVQNRLDSLEAAHYQRMQYASEQNRKNMDATAQKLQGMLATNQSLKDHWQKYGFN
jgi:hypothetical protein